MCSSLRNKNRLQEIASLPFPVFKSASFIWKNKKPFGATSLKSHAFQPASPRDVHLVCSPRIEPMKTGRSQAPATPWKTRSVASTQRLPFGATSRSVAVFRGDPFGLASKTPKVDVLDHLLATWLMSSSPNTAVLHEALSSDIPRYKSYYMFQYTNVCHCPIQRSPGKNCLSQVVVPLSRLSVICAKT